MLTSRFWAQVAVSFVFALWANAEQHTIKYVNKCGHGTPELILNGKDVLDGADSYTSNGSISGISYLQTGQCLLNGENCVLMEMTLINPKSGCIGCGSSTDISLIPPHKYNVETSFAYYNGCDGQGQTCDSADCKDNAFFGPNDNFVQVECQVNDVDLLIVFCANASDIVSGGGSTPSAPSTPISVPATSGGSTPNTGSSTSYGLPYSSSLPPPPATSVTPTPTSSPPPPTSTPTTIPTDTEPGCDEPSGYTPLPPQSTSTPTNVSNPGSGSTAPLTPTDTDPGCDEPTGPTTPPLGPTSTLTPSSVPVPVSVPPVSSAPTLPTGVPSLPPPETSAPVPTASQRCRPRPNTSLGLGPSVPASGSVPTGPAASGPVTPSGPVGTTFSLPPAPSDTPTSVSAPTVQRRRRHHRRSHDHHLGH